MKNKDRQSPTRESLLSSLDIREWSMKSFAEELYQNTGQLISLARVRLAAIDLEKKDETKETIRYSEQLLKKVIKNLRNLASQLSPSEIAQKGFLDSLQYEAQRLGKLGICEINFSVIGNKCRLEETRELILFSIIQHFLFGILYAGNAGKLKIAVIFEKELIKISLFYPANFDNFKTVAELSSPAIIQKAANINVLISGNEKNGLLEIAVFLTK